MRIVCLSDTHGQHGSVAVPDGDVLVHAGDIVANGTSAQIRAFNAWLGELPHAGKVLIAGNHDALFERNPEQARSLITAATYLEDSGAVVAGLRFWGSPVQPWFHDWAFNRARGEAIAHHWRLIPDDTEVLVVHGPPYGLGDCTSRGEMVGCADLRQRIAELPNLRLLVCGHVHEGYGLHRFCADDGREVLVANAAICDSQYRPRRAPIVVDL